MNTATRVSATTKSSDATLWCDERRDGLGGTDIAKIMGVSPYGDALDVYLDKVVGAAAGCPDAQTPDMRRGEVLEAVVATEWSNLTGKELRRGHRGLPTGILAHSDMPWMRANIDRVLMPAEAKTIVEIKVVRMPTFLKYKSTGIPYHIQVQGQHYLLVTGYSRVLFLIWCADLWDYLEVWVDRDEEIVAAIAEAGKRFWSDHVLTGVPPEPQPAYQPENLPTVGAEEVKSFDSPEWAEAVRDLQDAKEIMDGAKALEASAKGRLQTIMDEANTDVAEGAGVRAYWRYSKPCMRLDERKLQAAHPDINLADFKVPSKPSRPFKFYPIAREGAHE